MTRNPREIAQVRAAQGKPVRGVKFSAGVCETDSSDNTSGKGEEKRERSDTFARSLDRVLLVRARRPLDESVKMCAVSREPSVA